MTLVAEPRTSFAPAEVFAGQIVDGATALRENPDYKGVMGVASTTFIELGTYCGNEVVVAVENRQPSRTFKFRGAAGATLYARQEGYDVVTASTGSHGVSVGMAAGRAGLSAVVHVPGGIDAYKEERVRDTGARVVKGGQFNEAVARAFADSSGLFVHPYAMDQVLYGQGTWGLELADWMAKNRRIQEGQRTVVPVTVAGAGLLAAMSATIHDAKAQGRLGSNVEVIGVQPKRNNTMMRAVERVQSGHDDLTGLYNMRNPQVKEVDALAIGEESVDPRNLDLVARTEFVSRWGEVSSAAIGRALLFLQERVPEERRAAVEGVEPAGAVSLAYALEYCRRHPFSNGNHSERVSFVVPVGGLNGSSESTVPFLAAARRRASESAPGARELVNRKRAVVDRTSRRLGY